MESGSGSSCPQSPQPSAAAHVPKYAGRTAQPEQDLAVVGQLGGALFLAKPHWSSPGSCSVTLGSALLLMIQQKGIHCLLLWSTSPR